MKENIRKILLDLSRKNKVFRKIFRILLSCYKKIKYLRYYFLRVQDNYIIFCCYNGRAYACSPKAIYEYMISHKKYDNYKYIWCFNSKKIEEYNDILKKNKNTIVVKVGSKKYLKYISMSKFWIFNYKIDDYLKPKKGQIFVQCWHGTPLKRLGCDLINFDNVLNTINGMKKRYRIESKKISYFLSPSSYMTDIIMSAWNFKKSDKNKILELGYPRNDYLLNYSNKDVKKIKREIFGKSNINKKIILYAPTYRPNQYESGKGYIYQDKIDFDMMRKELAKDYIVLFRTHYFIANEFNFEEYKGFIYDVSHIDDINKLYLITDILITDYSSVLFDYGILKKPMIFYMPDLEHYQNESNGFYFDIKELPGKIVENEKDLYKEIRKVTGDFIYDKKYQNFNNKFNYLDDGEATKRVVEKIFRD